MNSALKLLALLHALSLLALIPATAAPLKVGDKLPEARVSAVSGDPVDLQNLQKPAVLIFYRGGWCPYCNRHLAALAEIENPLKEKGLTLYAISPDTPAKLKETAGRENLGYTLLSDSDMTAGRAFGITFEVPAETVATYKKEYGIDLEAASGRTHHLLPHPAVFIVNATGTIRFAHVNEDYKVRLTPKEVLEAADEAVR